jgi:hypothetical protein
MPIKRNVKASLIKKIIECANQCDEYNLNIEADVLTKIAQAINSTDFGGGDISGMYSDANEEPWMSQGDPDELSIMSNLYEDIENARQNSSGYDDFSQQLDGLMSSYSGLLRDQELQAIIQDAKTTALKDNPSSLKNLMNSPDLFGNVLQDAGVNVVDDGSNNI